MGKLRMPSLRTFIFTGRLGKAPEFGETRTGTATATLSVAISRHKKDEELEPIWMPVRAYGRVAEQVQHYPKGTPVFVDGYIDQEAWTDRETGEARKRLVTIANHINRLDWQDDFEHPRVTNNPTEQYRHAATEPATDDDLPF